MPNLPKRFDEQALSILQVIEETGGRYAVGDPGQVLSNLAIASSVGYFSASAILLHLEREGWVSVERKVQDEAKQANRIVAVTLL